MAKTKKPICQGDWADIRIRNDSVKQLRILKAQLELNTYDDVIQHLIKKK